jgi:hypothetical protein
MIRTATITLALVALVSAAAAASATTPAVALTAAPSRVALTGSGASAIRVTNSGHRPVVVGARLAGFALDLRGRPRIVPSDGPRTAERWLDIRPRRLQLRPGGSASVVLSARVPRRAEPGDHDALVLFTTQPQAAAGLAVRMRLGVVVVVRAPGRIVRRLALLALRPRPSGRGRVLELVAANRGNVTETLDRGRTLLSLRQGGKARGMLLPRPRDLRPRTRGVVEFPLPRHLKGWATARVRVSSAGYSAARTFRVRL